MTHLLALALCAAPALPPDVRPWHAAGHKGKGVKVAILDSGFRGYRDALGKVLPASVSVKSFRKDRDLEARDSQHGILCAEIVHRLAPEAGLLFANWEPESPSSFLDAVEWARKEGATVFSCSMIMPTWSDGEGGGPTHDRLKELLGKEALFFASAGNTALRHWGGPLAEGRDGWHLWKAGESANPLRPNGSE
ncbi:MAG: S8 family serine peptidase, partial [Gemmataceae bacterium]|nr:S8 family serine peptidase [Gemmataceae bacterium]